MPLQWKEQYVFHAGAEGSLTESTTIRAGFALANGPVPGSTLAPLTAAIFSKEIPTVLTWRRGRSRYEADDAFRPTASQIVAQNSLPAREYDTAPYIMLGRSP